MGVPKEKDLTPQEKFQADRLAKLQFAEIRNNRQSIEYLNRTFLGLVDKEKIPCNYRVDSEYIGFYTNHPVIRFMGRLFQDILDGKIILKEEV